MERKPYSGSEDRRRSSAPSGRPASSGRQSAPNYARPAGRADTRRYAQPQQRRPEPPRRPSAPRRRRRKDPVSIIIPALLLAILAGVIIYVGSAWFTTVINKSTFCSNIFINDVNITKCSREEGSQYVQDQLQQRMNTVYTLTLDDQTWSFCPADFNASIDTSGLLERAWNIGHVGNIFDCARSIRALKDNPIHIDAPLVYDESLVDAFIDQLYNAAYIAPTNAQVIVDVSKPYVASESARGQELDREMAKAQIISLVETGEGSTILPMVVLEPALSTESAMSTMDVLVEYTTDVTARGYNSRYNVRKALGYFNGMEVKPGDTVDFNAVVGPRIETRGWQSATEYIGNTTQEGFGGGVCQASTTLYGAMLLSGMTIIERWAHSMTVAYVDPSLDAAVTDTSKNLVFRNDTDHSIYLFTEVTKEYARVTVYGSRPQYRYELFSSIESQASTAVHTAYIDDVEGKFCYYDTDPPVLYKKGHAALTSNSYLVAFDWETGDEISKTWLSHDSYESGTDIYWRGVHARGAANTTSTVTGG